MSLPREFVCLILTELLSDKAKAEGGLSRVLWIYSKLYWLQSLSTKLNQLSGKVSRSALLEASLNHTKTSRWGDNIWKAPDRSHELMANKEQAMDS